MNKSSFGKVFLAAAVSGNVLFSSGCPASNPLSSQDDSLKSDRQENMQNSAKNNETISRDIDELAKNINLPIRPVEAVWKKKIMDNEQSIIPGPSDYYLTAVLKFDDADIEKVIELSEDSALKPGQGVVEIENWFPEDLKKFAKDEILIPGEKHYDPKAFSRAPYLNGNLTRVKGSNYFILKLFSS